MKNILVLLGKLMGQRSALIASLAAKGAPSDAEIRKLAEIQSSLAAVREVLDAKRVKTTPAPQASQPAPTPQAKRLISR